MTSKLEAGAPMRVHVLDNGTFVGMEKFPMIEWDDKEALIDFPCYTVLVEHPEGTVLYDCGLSLDPETQDPLFLDHIQCSEEQLPVSRLAQLGYEPDDIDYVVVSHMHNDHDGYLYEFKKSKIVVSDVEFTRSMKNYALGIHRDEPHLEKLIKAKLNWMLLPVEGETYELLPGVTLYKFGEGHSFDMVGMLLELKNSGRKLLVSDAIYSSETVGPPVREPGIRANIEKWRESFDHILELRDELGAELWYGHDGEQFASLIKAPDGYYD